MVTISFEPRDRLFQIVRQLQLPFPILSDLERDVYFAYSLTQDSLLKIFSPKTIWTYIKHFARLPKYEHSTRDWRKLGRDFILDEEGTVFYQFRGLAPSYRPSVATLIAKLDA